MAGSIPTEFGKLVNLTNLSLWGNELSGTPSLLILPGVVVRVYHSPFPAKTCAGGGGGGGASASGGGASASGVSSEAKICADALSVSYPPGAQVNRSSKRS